MENKITVPFVQWDGQGDDEGIIEALSRSFCESVPTDVNLLVALYTYEDYSGKAFVLYERDGKLFEVNASHCSCFGLEGDWLPEETTWEALLMRDFTDTWYGGDNPWNKMNDLILELAAERGVVPKENRFGTRIVERDPDSDELPF